MGKSQGEIFGIALLFVIIILGLIIYSQFAALDDYTEDEDLTRQQYNTLALNTRDAIMDMSTGCSGGRIHGGDDTLADLARVCVTRSSTAHSDPEIECEIDGSNQTVGSCSHFKNLLNSTLYNLFNNSNTTEIPFELHGELDLYGGDHKLDNLTVSNLGELEVGGQTVDEDNYIQQGFRRSTSGYTAIGAGVEDFHIELFVYYRP